MEALLAEQGEETPARVGSLRYIARQQLIKAGEDTAAAKEIADRLDGKVAQAIIGDDEADPVRIETIRNIIVDPRHAGSEGVPPATEAGEI